MMMERRRRMAPIQQQMDSLIICQIFKLFLFQSCCSKRCEHERHDTISFYVWYDISFFLLLSTILLCNIVSISFLFLLQLSQGNFNFTDQNDTPEKLSVLYVVADSELLSHHFDGPSTFFVLRLVELAW